VVNEPGGAFYFSVVFADEVSEGMNLRIDDRKVEEYIQHLCPPGVQPDRKFVYQLLVPTISAWCRFRLCLLAGRLPLHAAGTRRGDLRTDLPRHGPGGGEFVDSAQNSD